MQCLSLRAVLLLNETDTHLDFGVEITVKNVSNNVTSAPWQD